MSRPETNGRHCGGAIEEDVYLAGARWEPCPEPDGRYGDNDIAGRIVLG